MSRSILEVVAHRAWAASRRPDAADLVQCSDAGLRHFCNQELYRLIPVQPYTRRSVIHYEFHPIPQALMRLIDELWPGGAPLCLNLPDVDHPLRLRWVIAGRVAAVIGMQARHERELLQAGRVEALLF